MSRKRDWIVEIQAVVLKSVTCVNCTEEQARENPFDYSSYEEEVQQIDWEVRKVEPG